MKWYPAITHEVETFVENKGLFIQVPYVALCLKQELNNGYNGEKELF